MAHEIADRRNRKPGLEESQEWPHDRGKESTHARGCCGCGGDSALSCRILAVRLASLACRAAAPALLWVQIRPQLVATDLEVGRLLDGHHTLSRDAISFPLPHSLVGNTKTLGQRQQSKYGNSFRDAFHVLEYRTDRYPMSSTDSNPTRCDHRTYGYC